MKRWLLPGSVASRIIIALSVAGSIWVTWRAWLGSGQIRIQRWVDASGGYVEWRGNWAPEWLPDGAERLLRVYFDDISAVYFSGSPAVSPDGLRDLARLPGLETVGLDIATIGDDHIAVLGGIRGLETLFLGTSGVTDAGLAGLVELGRLEVLELSGTRIGDAGLQHLAPLTELKILYLDDTAVTDAGLASLRPLADLEFLSVGGGVTDAGIGEIIRHRGLQSIHFLNSPVTDTGIDRLMRELPGLEELELFYTEVGGDKMREIEAAGVRLQAAW